MRCYIYTFLACFFVLLNSSCQKKPIEIEGIKSLNVGECINIWQDEVIIDDEETFKSIIEYKSTRGNCFTYELPEIDFTERTVLARKTAVVACDIFYEQQVQADLGRKEYIYTIRMTPAREEECVDTLFSGNWISVPKLPANYNVRFVVEMIE